MAVNMVLLESACASCGKAFPESKLVRLDQHSEIGICFACLDRLEEQREQKLTPEE
jgi:hypothetical protein